MSVRLQKPSCFSVRFTAYLPGLFTAFSLPYLPLPIEHIINIWSNKQAYSNKYFPRRIYTFRSLRLSFSTRLYPHSPLNLLIHSHCGNTFGIPHSKRQNGGLLARHPSLWHTEQDARSKRKIKENRKSWNLTDWMDLLFLQILFFFPLFFSISAGSRVSGCRCTPLAAVLPWQPQSLRKKVWRDMKHKQTIFCRGLDLYASHIIHLSKPIEQVTLT